MKKESEFMKLWIVENFSIGTRCFVIESLGTIERKLKCKRVCGMSKNFGFGSLENLWIHIGLLCYF